MSNRIPTRSRVPISASKANKFDLSSRHIGTTNFGELKPIYCESVIPSDRFSLDVQSFTRLDPMPAQCSNCIVVLVRSTCNTRIVEHLGHHIL